MNSPSTGWLLLCALLMSASVSPSPASDIHAFDVVDLSVALPAGSTAQAAAIDAAGRVAANIELEHQRFVAVIDTDLTVPVLVPAENRVAAGIGGQGLVIGYQFGLPWGWVLQGEDFRCLPEPSYCSLGYIYAASQAYAINPGGVFTGALSLLNPPGTHPPYQVQSELYRGQIDAFGQLQIERLGQFEGQVTVGRGINAAGDLVGTYGGSPNFNAFLYRDGDLQALPDLGVSYNWAVAANDAGQVVGFVALVEQTPGYIKTTGAVWEVSDLDTITLQTIGQLGESTQTYLDGINDDGIAIGRAARTENSNWLWTVPIVWTASYGILDVNELLPVGSGWQVENVHGINTAGQVAATARFQGSQPRVVRLEPTGALLSTTTSAPQVATAPTALAVLRGIYPNPFNPRTTVAYELTAPTLVDLAVYDLAGRRVATLAGGGQAAGRHDAVWLGDDGRGRAMPSGVYLARLVAGGRVETARMVLVR